MIINMNNLKKPLVLFLLLGSISATATPAWEAIDELVANNSAQVIEWRRWFHQHPELSNREFNTAEYVARELTNMGLEVKAGIAKTGVVALLRGGRSGNTVALRADMDALPVREQTGLEFASTVEAEFDGNKVGVMHACGHDAHMAILLGAAKTLSTMRDKIPGNVLFIFQPAEEGAPEGEEGGAELMLAEGLFAQYKPDAVFGMHVGLNTPHKTIALRRGPLMAAVDTLRITVHGRQSHGARPWNGVDPIVTAAQIVNALQTIVSRQVDITQAPAIITIGKFSGGVRHNIIPDKVEMWGTIRSFDADMRDQLHSKIRQVVNNTAAAAGATASIDIDIGYPVTINDGALYDQMLPTLVRVSAGREILTPNLKTGAEDFSFFANQVPGIYFFLGSVSEGVDPATAPSNHSPMFDVDESVLEVGTRALSHLAIDFLANNQ